VAIGLGSSEIHWLIKKKTSRLKHKAFRTNVPESGQPNNTLNGGENTHTYPTYNTLGDT